MMAHLLCYLDPLSPYIYIEKKVGPPLAKLFGSAHANDLLLTYLYVDF